jgi:hypothetical protein
VFGHAFRAAATAAYEQGTPFHPTFGYHTSTNTPWWQQPQGPPLGTTRMPPPQGHSTQGPNGRPWAPPGPSEVTPPVTADFTPLPNPTTETAVPPFGNQAHSEPDQLGHSHFYIDPQERFASHNDTTRAAGPNYLTMAEPEPSSVRRYFDPSKISITPFAGYACPDVAKWIAAYVDKCSAQQVNRAGPAGRRLQSSESTAAPSPVLRRSCCRVYPVAPPWLYPAPATCLLPAAPAASCTPALRAGCAGWGPRRLGAAPAVTPMPAAP